VPIFSAGIRPLATIFSRVGMDTVSTRPIVRVMFWIHISCIGSPAASDLWPRHPAIATCQPGGDPGPRPRTRGQSPGGDQERHAYAEKRGKGHAVRLRLDGRIIAHNNEPGHCPGSGEQPAGDALLAFCCR
jgi:hypothetical protein